MAVEERGEPLRANDPEGPVINGRRRLRFPVDRSRAAKELASTGRLAGGECLVSVAKPSHRAQDSGAQGRLVEVLPEGFLEYCSFPVGSTCWGVYRC